MMMRRRRKKKKEEEENGDSELVQTFYFIHPPYTYHIRWPWKQANSEEENCMSPYKYCHHSTFPRKFPGGWRGQLSIPSPARTGTAAMEQSKVVARI